MKEKMFPQHNTETKYKKISERKKQRIWNSEPCTACGKLKENLIHDYMIGSVHLIKKDEEICIGCLNGRKKELRELAEEQGLDIDI